MFHINYPIDIPLIFINIFKDINITYPMIFSWSQVIPMLLKTYTPGSSRWLHICFMFKAMCDDDPQWHAYFQVGGSTTNQICVYIVCVYIYIYHYIAMRDPWHITILDV